jgi:ribosomal-protein-alanine N-acetyltransferase
MKENISDKIIIRPFKPEDLFIVSEIEQESFDVYGYPRFFFQQAFEVFGKLFRVAEVGGKIVGYVLGALQYDCPEAWLLSIAVLKSYRKKRIGLLLTEDLLKIFGNMGVKSVSLTVEPDNFSAKKLYQKFGFAEIDRIENYFGHNEPRIIMKWIAPALITEE